MRHTVPFSKRIITLRYDPTEYTRSECEYFTRNPGHCQGEPIYIPFMWDRILAWGENPDDQLSSEEFEAYCDEFEIDSESLLDSDDPQFWNMFDRYVYTVPMEDRLMFPELEHIDRVILWIDDQGFVHSESVELPFSQDTIFVGL
jgi:hypothetical protein